MAQLKVSASTRINMIINNLPSTSTDNSLTFVRFLLTLSTDLYVTLFFFSPLPLFN